MPLGVPTCRACAATAVCALGYGAVACAADHDAHCTPCAALPLGHAFAPPGGDCARTRCIDGWSRSSNTNNNNTNTDCVLCPAGWVCRGDAQTPCPGPNCTDTLGASQTLQCAGGPTDDVQFQYALLASDGRTPIATPQSEGEYYTTLDALMRRWLSYGVYQGCTRVALGTAGTLSCVVSVPQCVRALFREWLIEQLPLHQLAIAAAQGALVRLSSPRVYIRPTPRRANNNNNATRPTNAPALIIRARAWGQSHLQSLLTFGMCAATLGGLAVGAAAACALACLRWRRRAAWSETWAHLMEARRLRA
jgi:hypothetical protein